jgi:propionyl-CoA carboxylase alpha chain
MLSVSLCVFYCAASGSPHIEIQIMADSQGISCIYSKENAAYNVAIKSHRRSSFLCLTPELRKKMGEAAVLVAKSCDYLGAGTVEFIRRKNNFFSSK